MPTSSTRKRQKSARRDTVRRELRAEEIVDRLGAPLFMDAAPGRVMATCGGYSGRGADRSSALRALAEQIEEGEPSR